MKCLIDVDENTKAFFIFNILYLYVEIYPEYYSEILIYVGEIEMRGNDG